MFCREHVAQLRDRLSDIRGRGAELVVVGNGAPLFARGFREELALDAPLVVDPSLAAYRAAGMHRDVWGLLRWGTWKSAARALRGGFRQGRVLGDAWQNGGVLVVAPGGGAGALRYRYVSAFSGDHPPVDEVITAIPR